MVEVSLISLKVVSLISLTSHLRAQLKPARSRPPARVSRWHEAWYTMWKAGWRALGLTGALPGRLLGG